MWSVFSCHYAKQPASVPQVGPLEEDGGSKWYKQNMFRMIACFWQKRFSTFSFPTTESLALVGKMVNFFTSDVATTS